MRTPSRRTYLIVFVVAVLAAFLARMLWYYPGTLRISENPMRRLGFYRPPEVAESTPASIESLSGSEETTSVAGGEGRLVLVDMAHNNGFREEELAVFAGRLAGSGARMVVVEDETDLTDRLPEASALIVVAPDDAFEPEQVAAIAQFVQKGGRLVLIGDPTRQGSVDAINSLAGPFGVIYQDSYIYNLMQNDGGFRNVSFTEFEGDTPVTDGLTQVVFQTAYALRAVESMGIIVGDKNTFASGEEAPGGVVAAALTTEGRVLALPDFTFFTSPYNTFADNDLLLNNIAAFVLTGERGFDLADFPYFFENPTEIVYQNPVTLNATFEDSVALREALTQIGTPASLSESVEGQDTFVYIALYDEASEEILDLLAQDGVTVSEDPLSEESDAPDSDGSISVEGVARLERGGTVMMHLLSPPAPDDADFEEGEASYRLIVLADDEELLSTGIARLLESDLGACGVTPQTAVCRDGEFDTGGGGDGDKGEDEEEEAPPSGDVEASVLIVSDDSGLAGSLGQTSAQEIEAALSDLGVDTTVWVISEDGVPSLDDLAGFDAVFWTIGDYCCDAPSEDGAQVITDYLDQGGRLFIDGLFIATDWGDTDFLAETLSAEFVGFAAQVDLEAEASEHPLAEGFEDVITLIETDEPLQPDIINPLGDAEAVFVRGPESEEAGAASIIAYDSGTSRLVYSTVPMFLLNEDDLIQLLGNAVGWFGSSE